MSLTHVSILSVRSLPLVADTHQGSADLQARHPPPGHPRDIELFVDPQRKRKIRLVTALSVAVLLAVALVYTSFSASTEAKEPSQLLAAAPGQL